MLCLVAGMEGWRVMNVLIMMGVLDIGSASGDVA